MTHMVEALPPYVCCFSLSYIEALAPFFPPTATFGHVDDGAQRLATREQCFFLFFFCAASILFAYKKRGRTIVNMVRQKRVSEQKKMFRQLFFFRVSRVGRRYFFTLYSLQCMTCIIVCFPVIDVTSQSQTID